MLIPFITMLLLFSCGKNTIPPINQTSIENTEDLTPEVHISEEIIFQNILETEDNIELPRAKEILEIRVNSSLREELIPYYKEVIRHYHLRKIGNGAVLNGTCPVRHSFFDSLKSLSKNGGLKTFSIDLKPKTGEPILSPIADDIEIIVQEDHLLLKNLTLRKVANEFYDLEECKRHGMVPGDLVLDQFYPNLGFHYQNAGKKYFLELVIKFIPEESLQDL